MLTFHACAMKYNMQVLNLLCFHFFVQGGYVYLKEEMNVQAAIDVHWYPAAGMFACCGKLVCGDLECQLGS